MNEEIVQAVCAIEKAFETDCFYVSLLEDPKGFPSYFLGIDGRLKRNDCAYRLAHAIHCDLITYKEAIDELKKFSNDIIESEMIEEYVEFAGIWEQLPLWSQLELDQI